ncbi:MAG: type II toxin-antitoxin system PemK/MazF family toxin [Planctomycetes bacterium]|nr:type II toxin-antitoxin system PemK/MazF family toxin [Planctomycetota bacterium]
MASQFEYGDVLLVNYPFTDQSAAKQRPVLVISHTSFNQGEDIVVVPLSSRIMQEDSFGFPILETASFFPATGLRCSSTVKWTKLMTISRVVIKRKLGTIPAEIVQQIALKIGELVGLSSTLHPALPSE